MTSNTCLGYRLTTAIALAMVALLGKTAIAGTAQVTTTDVPAIAYEHAQQLVALADKRRLNLFCMGHGTPVVIFEAGEGDDSLSFRRVQARLAHVTRVCSYDRAGMGFSDPSNAPNTATHIINDLHALIRQADIPRPVILAGHSNGGLYAALYAASFPHDVAGMVMIDPNSLGQDMADESTLEQPFLSQWRAATENDLKQARICLNLAEAGALKRMPQRYPLCMDNPANLDPALHRLLNEQLARTSEQKSLLAEALDTSPQAGGGLSSAELTLRSHHFDFGDKPLIVLSNLSGMDELRAPQAQRARALSADLANEALLAAHSTRGKQILVESPTEYIQSYKPGVVVDAISEVIWQARKSGASQQTSAKPAGYKKGAHPNTL